ncbi:MAG TPA: TolC family protein [Planctomycetota bacterium]
MAFLALLLLTALPGGDDEARKPVRKSIPLSVREAVALSLNHNLDIEIARYQPWIEEQNVLVTLGQWDHVLYGSAVRSRAVQPGTSSLSGASKLESDGKDVEFGVRKLLPFGGSYDVFAGGNYIRSNNSFLLENPLYTDSAGVAITLPLLRGGSTAANTATLVIARNERDISVDVFEKTVSDSVFAVIQAYADLAFAIEEKKVKEQSVDVASRLLEDNRRKFDRGLASRLDVTQADAGVAAQQEGLLTAEAAVLNASDRLKRLVDPSLLASELEIVPVERPGTRLGDLDERAATEKALEQARGSRPEFRQLRRQMSSQDVEIARAANDRLPRLDFTGSGTINGTEGTFSEAFREADGLDTYDVTGGIIFEWAFENRAARGASQRAELQRRRLVLQERNLENQVLVEIREAVRAIKTNEKRIEATRRARVLAEEQLEGELTRNQQGLSTTFRVIDVQEDLVQARTNELKALIDYHLSRYRLGQVSGVLLEQQGILIRENLAPRVSLR